VGSTRQQPNWIYSILPFNVALGPVSTFVQLYILELHGSVIDIGLAVTLFNAVSIPAAMIWGFATDRFQRRKPIIVGSYLAVAGTLALFLFTRSIYGVDLLYSAFSLFSSAAATPLNLLVMETKPKSRWAAGFTEFSMVSSIGVTVGLVLGVAWGDFLPLYLIVAPLSGLCVLSVGLSLLMIKEVGVPFERSIVVLVRRSFYERLLALPLFFLRVPRMIDFRRVFKGLRYELARDTQVLYLSILMFYLASGIFNTSLVPSLYRAGVSKSQIFLVSLVGMVVQTFAFRYMGPYIERRSLRQAAFVGLVLRAICYGLIGLSVFVLTGIFYLGSTLVLYPLAAGIAYAAYYAASNVMVFNTLGRSNQGSALGVYSALVGFATMLGSFISGFTSFYFGFYVTFILAGLCLGLGAKLTRVITTSSGI
jgi:MFS family permease